MASIFRLPLEVRQDIWRIYYGSMAIPRRRYACDYSGTETSGSADTSLLYVCKQFHAEAYPIFLASIKLHVVYSPYSPGQLDTLPPRDVCDSVREILFHCGTQEFWGRDRPPKRPFPFHEFPRLATFRITKLTMVPLTSLRTPDAESTSLTPATYAKLSVHDKLEAWKRSGIVSVEMVIRDVVEFGRTGWLSRVVDPRAHTEPVGLEPDSDSEFDNEDWDDWTATGAESDDEFEEHDVIKAEARRQKLNLFRGIIGRMRTIVEVEYKVWHGDGPYRFNVIEILLVIVDTRDRKIVDYRLLTPEECEFRDEWSMMAT